MASTIFFLSCAVAFLAIIQTGSSLKCYDCYSETDGECGKAFSNSASQYDCSNLPGSDACYEMSYNVEGVSWTARSCGPSDICDSGHADVQCTSCTGDLCNN